MADLVRYCPACYTANPWSAQRCSACGADLDPDESYDARLIWALGHPDTATAVLAAQVLARRGTAAAVPALIDLVGSSDPYRAEAAAAALTRFPDDPRAAAAVAALAGHPSALVRRVGRDAVAKVSPGS